MKAMSRVASAINSRYVAFVDMMLGVCSIVFFYGGVQWEKQWMPKAEIIAIYAVAGACLAANFAYLLLRAMKGEDYKTFKSRKALNIIHFITGFISFGISVYAICILFGVSGGISSEEITRAVEAVRPNTVYLVFGMAVGITSIFVNGIRRTLKTLGAVCASSVAVLLIVSILTNASMSLLSPDMSKEKIDLSSKKLLWSDEFEGDKLDVTKWRAYDSDGYTTFYTPEQITVRNGKAYLRTEYRKDGKYGDGFYGAWLTNQDFFRNSYGYYEIRCIMPKAEGHHAAF